jgi:hypothetical protein
MFPAVLQMRYARQDDRLVRGNEGSRQAGDPDGDGFVQSGPARPLRTRCSSI